MKRYNLEDRKAAIQARRDAVLYLRTKKNYSWKAIAYAIGSTPERVKSIAFAEIRRRGDSLCGHQWTSGFVRLRGHSFNSLTCGKCGCVEYLNHDRKWTAHKPGKVTYPNIP